MINWDFKGIVDASDLGLKPGEWPAFLDVTAPDGEKVRLNRHQLAGLSGAWTYRSPDLRVTLTVLND